MGHYKPIRFDLLDNRLSLDDIFNIVRNAFADKAMTAFIDSVRNNDTYAPYIVEDDIFSTYNNFVNNIDNETLMNDFACTFNRDDVIARVVADSDGQLDAHNIILQKEDIALPNFAFEAYRNIVDAIYNKRTSF